jgi:hypothetical protein
VPDQQQRQQQQQQQPSQHPMPPSKHGAGQPFEKRSLILSPAEIYAEIVHHSKLASTQTKPLSWSAPVSTGHATSCQCMGMMLHGEAFNAFETGR